MTCACVRVDIDTTQLSALLRHIAPSVPEVPYEVALDMLRQTYTEFARKTSLLVAHQDIKIQREVKNYALEVPDGYEVFALLSANDPVFGYAVLPNVNHWYTYWGDRFRMLGNTHIEFERSPSRDDIPRRIALHVLPTHCANTIPTQIVTPYGKAIAMGALADMLDMPNKAWSNPRLADKKRIEFNRAVSSGRALHLTNRGAVPLALKPIRIL